MARVESGAVTRSKITEIHPMFTVAAFLPFLPLIEDAMIRQLGDDDFARREAATRVLERMLRDTDGIRNYWALERVMKVKENTEARRRAARLYHANKLKYILEHRYIVVVIKGGTDVREYSGWGIGRVAGRDNDIFFFLRGGKYALSKLRLMKQSKGFKQFVPVPDELLLGGDPRNPKDTRDNARKAFDNVVGSILSKERK
jgi:hypothetical protein